MPLFEIETESHIIITWAADDAAAARVVDDATLVMHWGTTEVPLRLHIGEP